MRIHAVLEKASGNWIYSNTFSSQSVVEDWIAGQGAKAPGYKHLTVDLPDAQWATVRANITSMAHNAKLACEMAEVEVHTHVPAIAVPEIQTPALAPMITEADLASMGRELSGLTEKLARFKVLLAEQHALPESTTQVNAIRILNSEVESAVARIAYLEAQLAPYSEKAKGQSTPENSAPTPASPTPQSMEEKLAALRAAKNP